MPEQAQEKVIPLEEAMRAQKALRQAAGEGEETFPLPAFIGMLSDEIETLRAQGRSDEEIASLIHQSSNIDIEPADIARHYAAPELRRSEHR